LSSLLIGDTNESKKESNVICLLLKAGIDFDVRIVKTMVKHYEAKNRLTQFFKVLKKCNITVSDKLLYLIGADVARVNAFGSLL
jgi:hypothetical protein